jgi:hypothetical protein
MGIEWRVCMAPLVLRISAYQCCVQEQFNQLSSITNRLRGMRRNRRLEAINAVFPLYVYFPGRRPFLHFQLDRPTSRSLTRRL